MRGWVWGETIICLYPNLRWRWRGGSLRKEVAHLLFAGVQKAGLELGRIKIFRDAYCMPG